jgi:hypothetical protein
VKNNFLNFKFFVMAEKNKSNQQKENQQNVTNQKEALQQPGNDTRDQHIKNDEITEGSGVKDRV